MVMMTKAANNIELCFWRLLIPMMQQEGILMKVLQWFSRMSQNKTLFLTLLIFLLAILGFVAGMILGKLIWTIQVMV